MYIEASALDALLETHEESASDCVKEKNYRDGMQDARKLLRQVEKANTSESYWFIGTNELFCHRCGKGIHKPRKGDKYEFCPHCGAKMEVTHA